MHACMVRAARDPRARVPACSVCGNYCLRVRGCQVLGWILRHMMGCSSVEPWVLDNDNDGSGVAVVKEATMT